MLTPQRLHNSQFSLHDPKTKEVRVTTAGFHPSGQLVASDIWARFRPDSVQLGETSLGTGPQLVVEGLAVGGGVTCLEGIGCLHSGGDGNLCLP